MKKTIMVLPLLLLPLFSFSSCSKKNIVEKKADACHFNYTLSKGDYAYFEYSGPSENETPDFAYDVKNFRMKTPKKVIYEGENIDSLVFSRNDEDDFYSVSCKESFEGTAKLTSVLLYYGNNNYLRLPFDLSVNYVDNTEQIDFPPAYYESISDYYGVDFLTGHDIVCGVYSGWTVGDYMCKTNEFTFRVCPRYDSTTLSYSPLCYSPFTVTGVSICNNDHVRIKNFSALTYDYDFYKNLYDEYLASGEQQFDIPAYWYGEAYEQEVEFPIKELPVTLDPTGCLGYDLGGLNSRIKMAMHFEVEDDYGGLSLYSGITMKFDVNINGDDYSFYRSVYYTRREYFLNSSFCEEN